MAAAIFDDPNKVTFRVTTTAHRFTALQSGEIDILARNTSVKNRDLYKKMALPGIDPDGKLNLAGMQADMEWWHSAGSLKQPVPAASVADTSFSDAAVKQLGPYR